jgi:hypothetical protein
MDVCVSVRACEREIFIGFSESTEIIPLNSITGSTSYYVPVI